MQVVFNRNGGDRFMPGNLRVGCNAGDVVGGIVRREGKQEGRGG